jgi:hypothetical protein
MSKNSLRISAILWGAGKVCLSKWSLRGVTLLLLDLDEDYDEGVNVSVGLGKLAIVV